MSNLDRAEKAEASLAELRGLVGDIKTWANSRCPCENGQPNPCPLCGADVNNPKDGCLSAENTLPRHLLTRINFALLTEGTADEAGTMETQK